MEQPNITDHAAPDQAGGQTETLSPALPAEIEEAASRLLEKACDREWMLATAESCTGGLLASLLTDVEGASHAFERGFVVYSEEAKCELLGIRRDQIDSCGAVSREVAIAMAEGAIQQSKADVALSITGFAGAASGEGEPGLVHLACARRKGPTRHRERHFGDIGRGPVRIASLKEALAMMEEAVDEG
ncbi:MAG: CinA family protein [Sphingobium sp.]|nr:CinA family protein [Sphingobium sp.]